MSEGGSQFLARPLTWVVLLLLIAVGIHRMREGFKLRGAIPGQRQMRWSFYVFFWLHVLIMVGSFCEFVFLRQSLLPVWSGIGFVLFVLSLWLRSVAIRTLGKFWSLHVEIRDQHELIRHGIYNFLRHPVYAAIVLEVVSIPMMVNAWWTMLLGSATYLPLLLWRLHWEERAMVEKMGESYRIYQREVGALLPKWSAIRTLVKSGQSTSE